MMHDACWRCIPALPHSSALVVAAASYTYLPASTDAAAAEASLQAQLGVMRAALGAVRAALADEFAPMYRA